MFRRYEPLIAEAVRNWPDATKFVPGPEIGLTTFTARLRDAVTSLRRFGWNTEQIDTAKFTEIGASSVVKADPTNECCWFCHRTAAGRGPSGLGVPSQFIPIEKLRPSGILENLTPTEITALCILLSNKRIIGPVVFLGRIPTDDVNSLLDAYDVGISYDELSNTTTLL